MSRALVTVSLLAYMAARTAVAQDVEVSFVTNGTFSIAINGKTWLESGEYRVDDKTSADGSLVQVGGASASSGTDNLGSFQSTTTQWAASEDTKTILLEATLKTYSDDDGLIVFQQTFPNTIGAPPLKADPGNMDRCRVAAGPSKVTTSVQGYNAYTLNGDGSFAEHQHAYCDDNHMYGYHGDLNLTECQAKCVEIKCTCFDYDARAPAPSAPSLSARTLFPSFKRNPGPTDGLNVFAYHGVFPSMKTTTGADYKESHQGGSPIVVYDGTNESLPMLVFSPLDFGKAHHMASSTSMFGTGVKATVTEIPAGWTQQFMISVSDGIRDGMMAWGDRMLKFSGRPRADKYLDQTHSTIGFWTDNGGYYHYATGDPKLGSTYEEVLPKVKAYHDSIGVPFGHWQFDSWFYPKDGGVNAGGGGGAVTNWTADPKIFPHGMAYIQSKLGLPTVMHNRQWSDKSDYIKNLPQYPWYQSKYAVPEDPIAFFTWFFKQQEGWGLSMYEQDWMCTEYDGVEQLQQNISLGDLWLLGMATGAASSNRTVQYCMPYPNDLLAAAHLPAVSNARASGDYFHGYKQWAVGGTSLFYWAIGILPFKDGFYSSTNKQIGGQTVGPELNPDRETIMATLSNAMVGPMDGIYLLNKSRVMSTCRGDGIVLKADRPVHTVDHCFLTSTNVDAASCYVYTTHTEVNGYGRVNYFYNDDAAPLVPAMVYADAGTDYVVHNYYSGALVKLSESTTVDAGYEGHIYATVSPVVNGWAFIGEPNKIVSAAAIRFPTVNVTADGVKASVVGTSNETVTVCATKATDMQRLCKDVKFAAASTQQVAFP